MEKTAAILKDIELMFLQAELRLMMLNGELANPLGTITSAKVLAIQTELENIHQLATKLENTLLKKLNLVLRLRLKQFGDTGKFEDKEEDLPHQEEVD